MIWNKGKNGTKCKLFLNMIRFPIVIGKIYQVRVLVSLKMIFEPKITTQQLNIKIFTLSIAFLRISKVKFSAHAIQFGSLKICMWYWLMTFKSFFFYHFSFLWTFGVDLQNMLLTSRLYLRGNTCISKNKHFFCSLMRSQVNYFLCNILNKRANKWFKWMENNFVYNLIIRIL